MKNLIYIIVFTCFIAISCNDEAVKEADTKNNVSDSIVDSFLVINKKINNIDTCDLEKILIEAGLVDVHKYDSSILVDLKYSSTDNFLGINMYGDLQKAYLHEEAARKLASAQSILKQKNSNYSLLVFDAVRPHSITKMMWDSIKVPENKKRNFLAHPDLGSMHNYGLAVDLTIVEQNGEFLDMATSFDSYEKIAYPMMEEHFLKTGDLSQQQSENRLLLRSVMQEAGFNSIRTEWWHFSIYSKQYARQNFAMITNHKLPEKVSIIEEMEAENLIQKEKETQISKNINISFRVQVLTSKRKIDVKDKIFKGLEIFRYHHDGVYKYTTGVFTDIDLAHKRQFEIWDIGFKDAFVAGFNNYERIGIYDAIELLELSRACL
jgi:zinc D-Ala-D-Ala dipeptidase